VAFGIILLTRTLPVDAALRQVLRSRTLIFFGTYSYALYIVHYVVRNAVFRYFPPLESLPTVGGLLFPWALLRAACAVGLSVVLALLSWQLIERRCLALKRYFSYGTPPKRVSALAL
jgi:peptidoglycan/LPS O-acetylase OafA/YrhL